MILDSGQQGKGYGTKLLNEAKMDVKKLNGWVIDHDKDKKPKIDLVSVVDNN